MKFRKRLLSLIVAVAVFTASIFLSINLHIFAVSTLTITGTNVNVRVSPSLSASSIGKANAPQTYEIKGSTSADGYTWYNITFSGKNGWIAFSSSWAKITTVTSPTPPATDTTFETQLNSFPESYRSALTELHSQYPNWQFTAEKINISFDAVTRMEELYKRKEVQSSDAVSRRTLAQGSYDWATGTFIADNGGWYGASREMIAFFMDPRNFLDSDIIMFLQQSYDSSTQTEDGVKKIISGTFLERNYTGGNYLSDIMEAAKQSGVSPYVIASQIIIEQGVNGTSDIISGTNSTYPGYYNFFNVKAAGATAADVINNGLAYAKQHGWNSRRASIIGGATFYGANYVSAGQDTFYYMDFNVKDLNNIGHQYAQSVRDAYIKTSRAKNGYLADTSMKLYFKIPVFNDMPAEKSPTPATNNQLNNYYITGLSVSGAVSSLTPSFDKFIYNYSLAVNGKAEMNVTLPAGASITDAAMSGNNLILTVKGAAGYSDKYTVGISSSVPSNLIIKVGGKEYTTLKFNGGVREGLMLGDPSGDGIIDIIDLAMIKMHILELKDKMLSGDTFTAADANKDGIIDIIDLAMVKMDILGVRKITQ
ncbi:MAG: SH3 domain-containing protein [Clostridia bacterium]|nr:SH3 domain-containing protein [Clostridia bacterium]